MGGDMCVGGDMVILFFAILQSSYKMDGTENFRKRPPLLETQDIEFNSGLRPASGKRSDRIAKFDRRKALLGRHFEKNKFGTSRGLRRLGKKVIFAKITHLRIYVF